ncbi:MAG: NAD(P)-dependent oxidoreductase [Chloroflexi bacterium]|nr:NAD(P)-dependent oxidoreductase [Chloroflexota bacterium]MBV9133427.1 NAD(P)-dependent oxidoreductase [Chloroflexota bacterium]MBV9895420.1 NAD(P)-dependent oxidoreductase [Chloroflexota bacterium]
MPSSTVAFVGLGSMGAGMVRCVARRGFAVRPHDVRSEPVQAFAEETGSVVCTSAAEAADGASAALVIVLTADQAADVVFGSDGLVGRLPQGAPVVCMSTMSPGRARVLADQAASHGLRWIDAPVSGGTVRAAEGTLTTMVGAEPADLEAVRPLLESFSRDVFHLGPVGAGSTAKLVNQVLVYSNLAATAEAVTLCRKLGVDLQTIYDVIRTAVGTSAIFEMRVPKIIDGSYASGGSMRIALKDLGIVEETARELALPMPMAAQATQLFRAAAASGGLDGDDLAIARLMEQLAGL